MSTEVDIYVRSQPGDVGYCAVGVNADGLLRIDTGESIHVLNGDDCAELITNMMAPGHLCVVAKGGVSTQLHDAIRTIERFLREPLTMASICMLGKVNRFELVLHTMNRFTRYGAVSLSSCLIQVAQSLKEHTPHG